MSWGSRSHPSIRKGKAFTGIHYCVDENPNIVPGDKSQTCRSELALSDSQGETIYADIEQWVPGPGSGEEPVHRGTRQPCCEQQSEPGLG